MLPMLLLILAVSGCGQGDSEFISDNLIEKVFENSEAARLTLTSGAYVDFPAGTFAERQLVTVSDLLGGSDNVPESFPTTTKLLTDRIAGIIINTPVDAVFHQDLGIRFHLEVSQTPGTAMVIYIHDSDLGSRRETYDNDYVSWHRYGAYTATVDASGNFADFTLDTSGNRGFIGTLALFGGHTLAAQGNPVVTEVRGTVRNKDGAGVSTDVELNYLIGAEKFPVPLLNGSTPAGGNVASIVTSDAAGNFVMQVPDIYISQIFNLSFGFHDSGHSDVELFTVNLPYPIRDEDVKNFVMRYGTNNISSQPVGTT
jgi:hypothetical protein